MCCVAGFIVQSYAFTRVCFKKAYTRKRVTLNSRANFMKTRAQYFKRRVILYLGVFLSSFVLVAAVWGIFGDWMDYFRLSRSGKWTTGKVVDSNHFEVKYIIDDRGYVSQYGYVIFESKINSRAPEQEVPVVYLPLKPQIACACDPRESLRNVSYTIALWSSLIALLVTFGYHHFRKDYWDE